MSQKRAALHEPIAAAPVRSERALQAARFAAALRGELHAASSTASSAASSSASSSGSSSGPPTGRLAELTRRFGLNALEADVLALLWVGAFDPELRAQAASREAYAGQITARLVARLLGHAPRARLPSESPLLLWQMVQEHPLIDASAALAIDPAIVAWLEGAHELDRSLAGRAGWLHGDTPEAAGWPLDATASRLREGLARGARWRVHLVGDDALAARWFAAGLGRRLGLDVLDVPAGALAQAQAQAQDGVRGEAAVRLQRQAFLDACVPCMALADAALAQPVGVPACPLQIIHGRGAPLQALPGVQDLECELPPPDAAERERLWRRLWPACAAWPPQALADLALCHEASASDIAAAAAAAPADAGAAAQTLRERARGDLGALARRVDGGFTWRDLVLPQAVHARLQEIAFEARERARVWAEPGAARLFPYGRGLVALFAGPPGTGKTMAAQVIAADLGLDLLAVDLSAVVSKWVGETTQHLQQLLASRSAQRAVLFFDEADALYAKRVEELRDAQDRYANLDSSHLMSALESYPGIVLLASNLKANIDAAFLRRIRHVVDFPRPGAAERERIWRQVAQALFAPAALRALEPGFARLAHLEATGAVIKNAALTALFAARRTGQAPTVALLGEMLARELAKDGAGLSARDLHAALAGAAR